jgi:hypothetical protein
VLAAILKNGSNWVHIDPQILLRFGRYFDFSSYVLFENFQWPWKILFTMSLGLILLGR